MGFTGDFPKMARLISGMKTLKRNAATTVTKVVGMEALTLVQRCFQTATDVNGYRWAPLRHRIGQPLQDTRRLYSSIAIRTLGPTRFNIWSNVKYAARHNFGGTFRQRGWRGRFYTVTTPRRQFIPYPGQMPDAWRFRLRTVAFTAMARLLP